MSKGYYIYYGADGDGVSKKIDMQTAEFSKYLPFDKVLIPYKTTRKWKKFLHVFPIMGNGYDYCEAWKVVQNPELLYIRKRYIDTDLITFLKKVKERYPNCKIIMELPVYPYHREMFVRSIKRTLINIPIYIKDIIFNKKLKLYIDYISTFSNDDKIFDIPTLRISNGVSVSNIKPISNSNLDSTIDLFAVALLAPQHGYERIIQGIGNYYKNEGSRQILFHLVGYGSEEKKYMRLVNKLGLQDRVIFYGRKIGEELDKVYEIADIAITHLALYKVSRPLGSFIKTGEYLAKGLPIITGCPVDVLNHDDFPYFIEFANDNSPIDMEKVIEFYDNVYKNKKRSQVVEEVRNYAYKKTDMPVVLKSIMSIIKTRSEI